MSRPMSDTALEALLKPVSAQLPCGKNLEYAPEFVQLMELARPKPEQTSGEKTIAAQEPPWPKVRDEAELLLGSTKDLRVAGVLHNALVKIDGVAGLSAGLALMRGLLERYWDNLYPPLEADEDNDPTFRLNCLVGSLSGDEALTLLRQIPLVVSRQFGAQSLRQYRIVTGAIKTVAADEQPTDLAQDLAKLQAAFQGADIAALKSGAQAAAGAVDHLSAIEKNLQDRTGSVPEGLAALRADVREINAVFAAELTRRGEAPAGDPAPGSADKPHGQAVSALQGEIRSRADVVRTLDALCDYYVRNEPSSPVPLLLKRAKRLVDKGFMDIIRDLAPAGVAEAEVIGGLENKES
jgi:type VI secretion system protein ImpA